MEIWPTKIEHVHLIGIAGTGMGSLAGLLTEAGFTVTGSDNAFYPPMGGQLRNLKITLHEGYKPENLKKRPDLVVIGNVSTKDNPESKAVLDQKIPYCSLPQALNHFFLQNKKTLGVVGTHGKTTTANLLAWVLMSAGLDPGFFIGGIGINFGKSYHLGKGDYFVIEGDEYDTAFFDKRPKFVHFRPTGAIWTSVEWDHADIYPTFEKTKEAFEQFVKTLSNETKLLAWQESSVIDSLISKLRAPIFRYGLTAGDYVAKDVQEGPEGTKFDLMYRKELIPFTSPLNGKQNLENVLGVIGLTHQLGISWEEIRKGIATFRGVKRRQEVLGEVNSITVIDDFAHHPTAVRRTLEGIKSRFPGRRIWAIFEPRSNTSRRKTLYPEYLKAFENADRVVLAKVNRMEKIPVLERLDPEALANDLMHKSIEAHYIPETDFIIEFILRGISPWDVVVFMSNGDFNNIHQKFLERLPKRKILADKKQVRSIRVKG